MATVCDRVQITYKGDGTQKLFTFPFTYLHKDDVDVYLWDDTTKDYALQDPSTDWSFDNATTIRFAVAPPVPPTVPVGDPEIFNVRISRSTDLTNMEARFYPGSAIRAQDLNDDFDQLRLAIEENRCQVPYAVYGYLKRHYWSKEDTITLDNQKKGNWISDDRHIATTAAISERLDTIVQDTKPSTVPAGEVRQPGKLWIDNGQLQFGYWEPSAGAWVSLTSTGPIGPAGTAATVAVGTTTTGATAAVTNSGTSTAAVLDFVLPRGPQGLPGSTGPAGPAGGGMTYATSAPITVSTVGTVATFGFDLTPLATLP